MEELAVEPGLKLGLAALPFLRRPRSGCKGADPSLAFSVLVGALLLAFEAVWLFLTAVGLFLRGPNWPREGASIS